MDQRNSVIKTTHDLSRPAVEDARRKAERLARLTGVRLGRVLAVEEAPFEGVNRDVQTTYLALIAGISEKKGSTLTSGKFEGVPHTVSLRVRFAIEP